MGHDGIGEKGEMEAFERGGDPGDESSLTTSIPASDSVPSGKLAEENGGDGAVGDGRDDTDADADGSAELLGTVLVSKPRPLLTRAINAVLRPKPGEKGGKKTSAASIKDTARGIAHHTAVGRIRTARAVAEESLERSTELLKDLAAAFPWFVARGDELSRAEAPPVLQTCLDHARMDVAEMSSAMATFLDDTDPILTGASDAAGAAAAGGGGGGGAPGSTGGSAAGDLGGGGNVLDADLREKVNEDLRALDRAAKTDPVRMRLLVSLLYMRDVLTEQLNRYLLRRVELLDSRVSLTTDGSLPKTRYLEVTSHRREGRRRIAMSAFASSQLDVLETVMRLEEHIDSTLMDDAEVARRSVYTPRPPSHPQPRAAAVNASANANASASANAKKNANANAATARDTAVGTPAAGPSARSADDTARAVRGHTRAMILSGRQSRRTTIGMKKIPVQVHTPAEDLRALQGQVESLRSELEATRDAAEREITELNEENRLLRAPLNLDQLPSPQLMQLSIVDFRKKAIAWEKERAALSSRLETAEAATSRLTHARADLLAELTRMRREHTRQVTAMEARISALQEESAKNADSFANLEQSVNVVVGSFRSAAKDRDSLVEMVETIRDQHAGETTARDERIADLLRAIELKDAALTRGREGNAKLYEVIRDLSARLRAATGEKIDLPPQQRHGAAPRSDAGTPPDTITHTDTRSAGADSIARISELVRDKRALQESNKYLKGRVQQLKDQVAFKSALVDKLRAEISGAGPASNAGHAAGSAFAMIRPGAPPTVPTRNAAAVPPSTGDN